MPPRKARRPLDAREVSTKMQPQWCDCVGGYCWRQWCPDKRRVHDALRLDPRYQRLMDISHPRPSELDDDDREV